MRPHGHVLALSLIAISWSTADAAVTLNIDSATVAESGQVAPLCVSLDSGGAMIAGTENLIYFDEGCARALPEGCRAAPAHGKSLFSKLFNGPSFLDNHMWDGVSFLKALVLSLESSDPIPDGELYCCNFVVDLDTPGDCCEVRIEEPGVSTPDAMALHTEVGAPGLLCLDPDAAPRPPIAPDTRTPTWTASPHFATHTPTPTVVEEDQGSRGTSEEPPRTATQRIVAGTPVPSGSGDDDGCQIVAGDTSEGGIALLLLPLLLLWSGLLRRPVPVRSRRGR